jgi:hypothetical protein
MYKLVRHLPPPPPPHRVHSGGIPPTLSDEVKRQRGNVKGRGGGNLKGKCKVSRRINAKGVKIWHKGVRLE